MELIEGLEPGEEKVVSGLKLTIRRVADAVEEPANSTVSKALSGIKVA